uniref:NBLA PROTEIN, PHYCOBILISOME DEGRADATION, PROTEIN.8A n=1 Tax=Phage sp. ctv3H3 TaxID=2826753 RepID=A0A8S5NAP6_9VIRU|nr:MAG TPA: NBLA PROTEIN, PHYCOBILISOME DEGRADATION, PROTEIN.8A [Phage sp. ctv3H3]
MQKIKMSNPTNLTLNQAFEMYLKKCKVRNLSDNHAKNKNVKSNKSNS